MTKVSTLFKSAFCLSLMVNKILGRHYPLDHAGACTKIQTLFHPNWYRILLALSLGFDHLIRVGEGEGGGYLGDISEPRSPPKGHGSMLVTKDCLQLSFLFQPTLLFLPLPKTRRWARQIESSYHIITEPDLDQSLHVIDSHLRIV